MRLTCSGVSCMFVDGAGREGGVLGLAISSMYAIDTRALCKRGGKGDRG